MRQSTSKPCPPSSPEERRQWISRFRASGLTQGQFAQQHGLKRCTLQAWPYRSRRNRAAQRSRAYIERNAAHPAEKLATSSGSPRQARAVTSREVTMPALESARPWAAEILLPDGVAVRPGASTSAAWIASLLGVVRQAC
jgi:hypothetical protein